ncbi:MAG TPA: hypothetical protein VGM77_11840 [Gemmatimonadales bacterium]|jgi:hypothetical protein
MARYPRSLGLALLLGVAAGGCHAAPFVLDDYGAAGPQIPGAEARVTASGSTPEWLAAGDAFYYAGPCLSRTKSPRASTPVASVDLVPAAGGSVIWERCEDRISLTFPLDSAAFFPAAAVNGDGAVVYVEADKRAFQGVALVDPVFEHTELWLSDTVESLRNRRHLMTLYNDNNGAATVGPAVINWFTTMRWTTSTTLLAIAINARPMGDDSTLGVARIAITDARATATILPGTERATAYSTARNGSSLVIARDLLGLFSVPAAGGAASALPTVPAAQGRHIVDVSCVADRCLVLTVEMSQSTFWRLDLTANTLVQMRRDGRVYQYARWSPTGGAVLAGESDGAHLFTDLMP